MVGSIGSFSGGPSAGDRTQFLQKAFAKLDQNGDGSVDKTELSDLLTSSSSSAGSSDVDKLFEAMDSDKDGSVTQDELNATLGKMHPDMARHMMSMQEQGGNSDEMAGKILSQLDQNSDGSFDETEFTAALDDSDGSDAVQVFDALDKNKDGTVTQDELSAALEQSRPMGPPPPPPGNAGSSDSDDSSTDSSGTLSQSLQDMLAKALSDDSSQSSRNDGTTSTGQNSQDDVQRLLAHLTRSVLHQYDAASQYGQSTQQSSRQGTSIAA